MRKPFPASTKDTSGNKIFIKANNDHSLIPKFEIKIGVAIKLPNNALNGPK